MKVRGNVVSGINDFVQKKFPEKYALWYDTLSDDSKNIYNKVASSQWYPVEEAVIEPTRSMCDMFFVNEKKGSWESGRYSAEIALTGVYKVFVLVSKPGFIIKRAGRMLPTFYDDTEIHLIESSDTTMTVHITRLPIKDRIIEYRIAGWMEKAMEICGCHNLKVSLPKSIAGGDEYTEIKMMWE
ncbi:hypothetical protein [Reichenbachiella versicolor]|uniref:hypothetical protein n=1 Tax=Reichenbachiella versicolor TaxID=1821036 RepID=UPI000D6E4CE6|nr:hypothetical protein [Reichenbachiella versicolor]